MELGGFIALLVIVIAVTMVVMTKGKPSRDVVDLPPGHDFRPAVHEWAMRNGFEAVPAGDVARFRKGKGVLVNPMFIDVVPAGDRQQLVTYLTMSSGFNKRDLALTHRGFPKVPARNARLADQLLGTLNLPPLVRR